MHLSFVAPAGPVEESLILAHWAVDTCAYGDHDSFPRFYIHVHDSASGECVERRPYISPLTLADELEVRPPLTHTHTHTHTRAQRDTHGG